MQRQFIDHGGAGLVGVGCHPKRVVDSVCGQRDIRSFENEGAPGLDSFDDSAGGQCATVAHGDQGGGEVAPLKLV